MAKIVIHNETDPGIGIILNEGLPQAPSAPGFHGTCTQCGWPMHRWDLQKAIDAAQAHVDRHSPAVVGGDRDALVRG